MFKLQCTHQNENTNLWWPQKLIQVDLSLYSIEDFKEDSIIDNSNKKEDTWKYGTHRLLISSFIRGWQSSPNRVRVCNKKPLWVTTAISFSFLVNNLCRPGQLARSSVHFSKNHNNKNKLNNNGQGKSFQLNYVVICLANVFYFPSQGNKKMLQSRKITRCCSRGNNNMLLHRTNK